MSDQLFPIPCRFCGKSLYGPVSYCPYCGVLLKSSPAVEAPVEQSNIVPIPGDKPRIAEPGNLPVLEKSTEPKTEIPPEKPYNAAEKDSARDTSTVTKTKEEPLEKKEKPEEGLNRTKPEVGSSKWKWISVALVLIIVLFGGYWYSHTRTDGTYNSPLSSKDSRKEIARVLALDALRQGTDLSGTISKLPKLEYVLEAAKKLQEISPRYQEQVTSAQNTINNARSTRDKQLMAYISKILELSRYSPEAIAYAVGFVQNGDTTPREKIVAELMDMHLKALRNKKKGDPTKILSDFTKRFHEFMD